MPADSPYFDRTYFDPAYFDDNAAPSGRAPTAVVLEEPIPVDEDFLEWIP